MNSTQKIPLTVCEKQGIVIAEVNIKSSDGVCFIYDDQPFIFIQTGLPERKRSTVLAYLEALLMLGYVGAWEQSFVKDRRGTPPADQEKQIGVYMDHVLNSKQEGSKNDE